MGEVSGNGDSALPDFNSLSESEQRAVAERLLRVAESGWKPFWCPRPTCNGSPHPLLDEHGAMTYVDASAKAGPNGEPVMNAYDVGNGTVRTVADDKEPYPTEPLLGRVVLNEMWAHPHARVDQRLPSWLKTWVLFIMSGRGSGKTRTGVEFVTLSARKGQDGAIIGRRGTELVNTHVAALIEHAHPDFMPTYHASKDLITWPNGATTFLFSAERPENIRSVNLSYFWMDEAAFMDEVDTAWMNARMATRIEKPGNPIHILITSTPTATKWVMEMEDDEEVEVRRVSTYANRTNLSPDYLRMLEKKYEGTRMGRQELHGEVLRDVEGALWNDDMFNNRRVDLQQFAAELGSYDDVVVAVDPAGSKGKRSDATGIIAVGAHHEDAAGFTLDVPTYHVLADGTIKGSPTEWAAQTYKVARHVDARRIVVEKNFGGDMVKQVLNDYAKKNPAECKDSNGDLFTVKVVHAVKSKETRAEATVGKYEQGRVEHVASPSIYGDLSELEKEQTTWVPKSRGGKLPSPNRIDALVWAMKELETVTKHPTQMSNNRAMQAMIRPVKRVNLGQVNGRFHIPG